MNPAPTMEMGKKTAGVIAPPPLIYLGGLISGMLLHLADPTKLFVNPLIRIFGAVLLMAGIIFVSWAFREMDRARTHANPYQATTSLVVEGPFRFSRNPIYLSMMLLYLGITALVNSAWPLLFLPAVLLIMRIGVIDREERYLEQKFGEDYLRYKRSVRRWF